MNPKLRTFLKGLGIAVLAPALYTIVTSLAAGNLNIDWKSIGIVALAAFGAYLLKTLFPSLPPATPPVKETPTNKYGQ